MKKNGIKAVTFLGCSLPWAFFGMYGDAQWGTLALYGVMVLCLGGLWWLAVRERCLVWAGWGSTVSLMLSELCAAMVTAENWRWYFKPFSAVGMSAAISVAIMLVLGVVMRIDRKQKTA